MFKKLDEDVKEPPYKRPKTIKDSKAKSGIEETTLGALSSVLGPMLGARNAAQLAGVSKYLSEEMAAQYPLRCVKDTINGIECLSDTKVWGLYSCLNFCTEKVRAMFRGLIDDNPFFIIFPSSSVKKLVYISATVTVGSTEWVLFRNDSNVRENATSRSVGFDKWFDEIFLPGFLQGKNITLSVSFPSIDPIAPTSGQLLMMWGNVLLRSLVWNYTTVDDRLDIDEEIRGLFYPFSVRCWTRFSLDPSPDSRLRICDMKDAIDDLYSAEKLISENFKPQQEESASLGPANRMILDKLKQITNASASNLLHKRYERYCMAKNS